MRLTEGSLYSRFSIESSPKWGFGMIFGVGARTFGGKVHSSSELRVFRQLCSRSDASVVALCIDIAICHRQKFGQVWGSSAPLSDVAGNFRYRKASL